MAIKTFTAGSILTASDTNTYLANAGLVYINQFSLSGTATSCNDVFSSTYDSYRIIVSYLQTSANTDVFLRMRVGGADAQTADYAYAFNGLSSTNVNFNAFGNGTAQAYLGLVQVGAANTQVMSASWDIHSPFRAQRTFGLGQSIAYDAGFAHRTGFWEHNLTTSYTGFSILTLSAATMTGQVTIYGYRKP